LLFPVSSAFATDNPSLAVAIFCSLYAKYYFALRSLLEKSGFRNRYNQMVGGVGGVAASEALKVSKRSEVVKEEALQQLSRSLR
jgi:hypothetical protein